MSGTPEGLQSAPGLQQFILKDVKHPSTPKRLGTGSYGSVDELVIGGIICAGKTVHDALIDVENEGADNIVQRYIRECHLMASLRHPHIVQFMGICFLPGSQLPVLVMEYLSSNLDAFLEKQADIPLFLKRSILHDVARGLIYLHGRTPPVIHRDLTARNVLLSSMMTAKIADFGNSRLVDALATQTLTQFPGTLAYLPPEALDPHPHYNTKLDMFSFGHLSLYTIIQVFPMPIGSTYTEPQSEVVVARSEVERRSEYLQVLRTQVSGIDSLQQLIVACLDNTPDKRPSAAQAMDCLAQLSIEIPDPYRELNRFDMMQILKGHKSLPEEEAGSTRKESWIKVYIYSCAV